MKTVERVVSIPTGEIHVDPGFNARKTYRELDKLAASIRTIGLQEPIVVESVEGKYWVRKGHRRYFAHVGHEQSGYKAADMPAEMTCIVREYKTRDEAMLAALSSDATSDPVRNYDLAERCWYFTSQFGMPATKLAERIGRSAADVNMLLACFRELCPEVKAAWGAAPDPDKEIPISRLNKWRKESSGNQQKLLLAYQGGDKPVLDDTGKPVKGADGKRVDGKRPTLKVIRAKVKELSEGKKHPAELRALRWVLGELTRFP